MPKKVMTPSHGFSSSHFRLPALVAAATAVVMGASAGKVDAAASLAFLPHQALYDLSLMKSRGSNSINSARGRLLYNFSGSACEGYTSEVRQVQELDSGEDKLTLNDNHSTTWESANGTTFRFKVDSRTDDSASVAVDGVAERDGDHITVKLKRPAAKTFKIDGSTVFPTEQIHRIIDAARAGKSLLELAVYDGSDNGEKVFNTLTVIGKEIPGDRAVTTPDASTESDAMKSLARWPVTVSYFDRDDKTRNGEQTPLYATSFELYENGVSRALVIDYNDFVVAGALGKFSVKTPKPVSDKPCK